MVQASSDGYFVTNGKNETINKNTPATALPCINEKEKERIENDEQIIAKFSDI